MATRRESGGCTGKVAWESAWAIALDWECCGECEQSASNENVEELHCDGSGLRVSLRVLWKVVR